MAFFTASLALIVLGILLCYPPVFEPIVDLFKAAGAK
jgi:hypothetical protein